jgi:hypothetical protein
MLDNTCPICGQTVMSSLLKLHIQLEKRFMKQQRALGNLEQLQTAYQKYYLGFRQEAQDLQMRWGNVDRLPIMEGAEVTEGEPEEAY